MSQLSILPKGDGRITIVGEVAGQDPHLLRMHYSKSSGFTIVVDDPDTCIHIASAEGLELKVRAAHQVSRCNVVMIDSEKK